MSAPTGHAPRLVQTMTLFLPGKPITRHEPQKGRHGFYSHPATIAGMNCWRELWMIDGRKYVEGPVIMEIYIRVRRPAGHRTKAGELTAEGKRRTIPTVFDCSNVAKLVEDALKDHAFGDDTLIVSLHVHKRWATLLGDAGTEVSISQSL